MKWPFYETKPSQKHVLISGLVNIPKLMTLNYSQAARNGREYLELLKRPNWRSGILSKR